jgi:ABC-type transport system involved in multi-copper enzyme maturation permease subunit
VAASGLSRWRIALEKLAGHLTGLTIVFVVTFVSIAIAGAKFATLPGDELSATQAVRLCNLDGADGTGGRLGRVLPSVRSSVAAQPPALPASSPSPASSSRLFGARARARAIANLTWSGWTINHLPLAGQFDWPSVAFLAIFVVIMLTIGLVAFARRDIGVTSTVPTPSLPRALVGLGGPVSRSIGHNLSAAIAWGLGIGIFGLLLAGSSTGFTQQLQNSPDFMNLLSTIFPNVNFSSVGGFLQLLFIEIGIVLIGLSAVTLVAGWASDETSGRLEFLLATPLSRVRWAGSGGVGILVDMALVVLLRRSESPLAALPRAETS